jgi:hypothetical protein
MPGGSFRVHKKVISLDTGRALLCCWTDCERYGYDLYKAQVNYAAEGFPPEIVKYVFCSETHKMYWVRSGQRTGHNNDRYNDGQLASGDRRRY